MSHDGFPMLRYALVGAKSAVRKAQMRMDVALKIDVDCILNARMADFRQLPPFQDRALTCSKLTKN